MSNATQSSNAAAQYREVQRKANAGERIKIVNVILSGGRYNAGDEFVVDRAATYGVYVNYTKGNVSGTAGIHDNEYVVLEPIAPTALSLPDLFAQFIRDNAGAVRSYLAEIDPDKSAEVSVDESASEPQLTRAKVIEMARDRVAYLTARLPFNGEIKFRVNRERRTVVAEVYRNGVRTGKFYAKCAPDDVFNADIGKAIAAERAIGLTLTDAFVNAPKPEKAVVGSAVVDQLGRGVVTGTSHGCGVLVDGGPDKGGFWTYANGPLGAVVVDDTDAVYAKDGEAA